MQIAWFFGKNLVLLRWQSVNDGFVDAVDASAILAEYARLST